MNACTDARPLIMSYLDGELSEAQAAPLRKHLLECQPCRASAQDEKNLTRWFSGAKAAGAPVLVPRDFAARVARRAFQGDRGALTADAQVAAALPGAAPRRDDRQLRFVLGLTAAAAAVVLFFAISIRQRMLPTGQDLRAQDLNESVQPLDKTIQELDRLNARERDAGRAGAKPEGTPSDPGAEGRRP